MKQENNSIDILKFALSLVVVAIHTQLLNGGIYPFARIAVPLFFMISSWFFFEKYKCKEKESQKIVLKNYIKRNLTLYLFWFVILFPITYLSRDYFKEGIILGILKICKGFLFGSTFLASWYIMASIIATFLVCILEKRLDNKKLFAISIAGYLLCLLTSNYEMLFAKLEFGNILMEVISRIGKPYNNFCVGIFWVTIGKILVDNKHRIFRGGVDRQRKIWLCVALFLLWLENIFIKNILGDVINNDCYIMLFPVCVLSFIIVMEQKISFKHTKRLRNLSTIIYCSHLSIVVVFRRIFTELNIIDSYHIKLFAASVCMSMFLGFLIFKLEKRIKILKYAF